MCGSHVQVYTWWKNCECRILYPSTLYVTAKSIAVPNAVDPAMRSMHAVQEVNWFLLPDITSDFCLRGIFDFLNRLIFTVINIITIFAHH